MVLGLIPLESDSMVDEILHDAVCAYLHRHYVAHDRRETYLRSWDRVCTPTNWILMAGRDGVMTEVADRVED